MKAASHFPGLELKNGSINKFTLDPTDLGLTIHPFSELIGGAHDG